MHPLTPLGDRERCAASVTVLAAAAAPKRASRAVRPGEKRRCCVPSAWAAEYSGSGVGCSLTRSRTQLLCHPRGRGSGRSQVPDWITQSGPRLLWLASSPSSPTQRKAVVFVCECG